MAEDEDPTTDEILAAFRSRRQEPAPTPLDRAPSPPQDDGEPLASGPAHEPTEPPSPMPQSFPPSLPPPPEQRWPAVRPAVQSGGSVVLSAGAPALNLSSRLMEDRFVSRSGNRTGVVVGVVLALLGLATVLADQALASRGLPVTLAGVRLTLIGFALAGMGLVLALAALVLPRGRSLRVRLAGSQREEWARVQAEAARLRVWSISGAVGAIVGLAGAAAAYAFVAPPASGYAAGALAALGLVGVGLLAWAAARRGVVQRLYVQTLVLSRLEQTGLGPAAEQDPRIAPVLRSLDKLLGALPESAVRRFLASDEATKYLELIDDLAREPRDGR